MEGKKGKPLFEKIEEQLFHMIVVEGTYKPGEKLPNENEMSEMLGISRTTLREAMRALSAQGILEARHGAGTFIAKDLHLFKNDYGFKRIERVQVRLNDLFELRSLIEPDITYLACFRATEEELRAIEQEAENVEREVIAGRDFVKADRKFHKAIALASHNEFMVTLIDIINKAVTQYFQQADSTPLAQISVQDHRQIMGFMRKRDPSGCRYAMSIHMHHAFQPLNISPLESKYM